MNGVGYAIVGSDGVIDIRTVQDSRVGAIVNALVYDGYLVTRGTSETAIERVWNEHRGDRSVFRVTIHATEQAEV
jgi:hypothetical protein